MIYCEELYLGKWWPVTYSEPPSKPSHGNSAPQRRGQVQVMEADEGRSLDDLQRIYGTPQKWKIRIEGQDFRA